MAAPSGMVRKNTPNRTSSIREGKNIERAHTHTRARVCECKRGCVRVRVCEQACEHVCICACAHVCGMRAVCAYVRELQIFIHVYIYMHGYL